MLYLLDLPATSSSSPRDYAHALDGKSIALLFEKPSLRTKLTFELAIKQLGGDRRFCEGPIGVREPLKDVARNLDRWVNGIVAARFRAADGGGSGALVVGAGDQCAERSVSSLPGAGGCADACSERFGGFDGLKLAFIGDGNNVAQSLMLTVAAAGHGFRAGLPARLRAESRMSWRRPRGWPPFRAHLCWSPRPGSRRSPARTPSTRTSGPAWAGTAKRMQRKKAFRDYQVNEKLFAHGAAGRDFHALPSGQARRGGHRRASWNAPRSAVFDQAENRLHAQKALLLMML